MLKALSLTDEEKNILTLIQSNEIPSYRQAYSDRTAWLMACLSELAYQPFGISDAEPARQLLQEKLDEFLVKKTTKKLNQLISTVSDMSEKQRDKLFSELEEYDLSIVQTYDRKGTQALLLSANRFMALVFRGTEAHSFQDIKADAHAVKMQCPPKGSVHSGFYHAFSHVEEAIKSDLKKSEYADKPLIIAGHSLGGALATIAAKRLTHTGGIACCYTFGSPRVGDEEWAYGLKTPIYRVVNALDCVTMLPPGDIVIKSLKLSFGRLPVIGSFVKRLLSKFEGYKHSEDMRYLTSCSSDNYEAVQLTYAVSIWRRFRTFLKGARANRFIKDHSISVYRRKLAVIAQRNN